MFITVGMAGPTPPWYARFAWIVFVLTSSLVILFGISGEDGPVGPGSMIGELVDPVGGDGSEQAILQGTFALGMGALGLAVAIQGYRRFNAWAWWVSLVWPVFFTIHILAFDTLLPDGVFLALVVLALVLPVRMFFGRSSIPALRQPKSGTT